MGETNGTQVAASEDKLSRLPYTLSRGVTATREGLRFRTVSREARHIYSMVSGIEIRVDSLYWNAFVYVSWPDAIDRLRYRDGEPWCLLPKDDQIPIIELRTAKPMYWDIVKLHRLAAILCDDAEAFRALHWCVTNLGGENA